MADFSRHLSHSTRTVPRRLVQIWVALGLHPGYITYRLIQAFLMFILRILRNQPANESSILTLRTSYLYRLACKVVHRINKMMLINGGGQKTKSCRKLESDQQWHLQFANQGFARMVTRHQYLAAIIQQHHHLRLIITMHHLC